MRVRRLAEFEPVQKKPEFVLTLWDFLREDAPVIYAS